MSCRPHAVSEDYQNNISYLIFHHHHTHLCLFQLSYDQWIFNLSSLANHISSIICFYISCPAISLIPFTRPIALIQINTVCSSLSIIIFSHSPFYIYSPPILLRILSHISMVVIIIFSHPPFYIYLPHILLWISFHLSIVVIIVLLHPLSYIHLPHILLLILSHLSAVVIALFLMQHTSLLFLCIYQLATHTSL